MDIIPFVTNSNLIKVYDKSTNLMNYIKTSKEINITMDTFGPYVISAGKSKQILLTKIDSLTNHKHVAVFKGHSNEISSIFFAPKYGKFIASVSEDNTLKIWNIEHLLEFSETSDKSEMEVITAASNTVFAHKKSINAVRIAPNDKVIATGS